MNTDTKSSQPQTPQTPNLYEFKGPNTQITYSTSHGGVSRLTYQHNCESRTWSGDEIRTQEAEIGRLVTVTLEAIPDLHTVTLTVLVPPANLNGSRTKLSTEAIRTTMKTSIGGPRLVKGQIAHYELVKLQGEAKSMAA
jgi:hypothetical protein